jgi:anti-sigma28 factor (negative regulator of flagellin synthesis)
MVADKIATMKQGDNQHAPIGATSQSQAAKIMQVGRGSVQRAHVVRAKGVPELQRAVETGNLAVSVAAEIAQHPEEDQVQMMAEPASVRTRIRLAAD